MISFRYHIVSIVSVFLALAVGIALGGGPLKGEVDNTLVDQVKADRAIKADLQAQVVAERSGNGFDDQFAAQVAPQVLAGSLKGRDVAVVVLPGAAQTDVSGLVDLVGKAGGTVTGTLRVGNGLVDPANKQLVDQLGSQLLDSAPGVAVSPGASPYQRMGALIARAIGTDQPGGAPVDSAASSILAGLSTAGMMSAEGNLDRRADLVLFVAGGPSADATQNQGESTIVSTLVTQVDQGTGGVVLAGPIPSAREGGVVKAVRDDVAASRDVSTVDTLGREAGRVVAVMALGGQAHGSAGQYGALGAANGPMPGAQSTAG